MSQTTNDDENDYQIDKFVNIVTLSGAGRATLKRDGQSMMLEVQHDATANENDCIRHSVENSTLTVVCGLHTHTVTRNIVTSNICVNVNGNSSVGNICFGNFSYDNDASSSVRTLKRTIRFSPSTTSKVKSVHCSGTSRLSVDVSCLDAQKCNLKSSGAAKITVMNNRPKSDSPQLIDVLEVTTSGASKIDCDDVRVHNLVVGTSGASAVHNVFVVSRAQVRTSGASRVDVCKSSDAHVTSSTSGASVLHVQNM